MAISTILALLLALLLPLGARSQEEAGLVAANRALQERKIEERIGGLKEDPDSLYFARSELAPEEQEKLAQGHLEEIMKLSETSSFDSPDHAQILDHAKAILRQAPDVPVTQMVHWNIHNELFILEQEAGVFEALETYAYKYPDDTDRVREAWDRLANQAADRGDWGLSLYYIDRYLESSGEDYPRLLVRAQALIGLGDRETGRALLERIVAESEGTVEFNLAMNELEELDAPEPETAEGGPTLEEVVSEDFAETADSIAAVGSQAHAPELARNYRETIESIRQATIGMEVYYIDWMEYPQSFAALVPDYLEEVPVDAWGGLLQVEIAGDVLSIGSGGSDGIFDGFGQQGLYTDLEGRDIIFSDGTLVFGPSGDL